jgi:hypothetical protein
VYNRKEKQNIIAKLVVIDEILLNFLKIKLQKIEILIGMIQITMDEMHFVY